MNPNCLKFSGLTFALQLFLEVRTGEVSDRFEAIFYTFQALLRSVFV